MKIVFKKDLKDLAMKLGKVLGVRTQDLKKSPLCQGSAGQARTQDNESILFVGRGLVNNALGGLKTYPKCWEIGKKADSFDYLAEIILNGEIVEKDKPFGERRKNPDHIVAQVFDFDCGWGGFCTLMLMLGREEVLKTDLYKRLEVNEVDGTRSEKIKEVLDEEDINYLEIWNGDLGDVEKIISLGGACLVSYQAWGETEEIERLECGHYSIVFDIDEESVWLIDPSKDEEYTPGYGRGVIRRLRSEFEKLWIDKGSDGTIYEKWLLAVRI